MPEYRRFIAYFYEYIDGKKQKNAGFAKVELRNGMWRILFRLNTETEPLRPVQAYGFVREQGWQLGLYMGSMRPGMVRMEEWAYRADVPVWNGKYGFASLAGIWMQSEDGRRYVTVWDDEPIFADRFVLALPKEAVNTEDKVEEAGRQTYVTGEMQAAEITEPREKGEKKASNVDDGREETLSDEGADSWKGRMEGVSKAVERASDRAANTGEAVETVADRITSANGPDEDRNENQQAKQTEHAEKQNEDRNRSLEKIDASDKKTLPLDDSDAASPARAEAAAETCEALERETPVPREPYACRPSEQEQALAMLFANRPVLEPFQDTEFRECVQLRPCDLVRLQQANCRVGRNTFLQHGFYQYHHLLLAKDQEGRYILGVPGIVNAQERYMAGMFSFDRFKPANGYDRGRTFGYWCKEI